MQGIKLKGKVVRGYDVNEIKGRDSEERCCCCHSSCSWQRIHSARHLCTICDGGEWVLVQSMAVRMAS